MLRGKEGKCQTREKNRETKSKREKNIVKRENRKTARRTETPRKNYAEQRGKKTND